MKPIKNLLTLLGVITLSSTPAFAESGHGNIEYVASSDANQLTVECFLPIKEETIFGATLGYSIIKENQNQEFARTINLGLGMSLEYGKWRLEPQISTKIPSREKEDGFIFEENSTTISLNAGFSLFDALEIGSTIEIPLYSSSNLTNPGFGVYISLKQPN